MKPLAAGSCCGKAWHPGAWLELVENLITAQERRERRLAGTSA